MKEILGATYCFSLLIGLGFYCELNSHIETMAGKDRGAGSYKIISGDQKIVVKEDEKTLVKK